MSEKLKKCPFCGADDAWAWPYDARPSFFQYSVRCGICGMGNDGYATSDEATEAWNRREND